MRHIQDRFSKQLIDQFEISFLLGLLHLATEFLYIAIGLSLGLVAADDCHDLLRVILAHLGGTPTLSVRIRRYSGDQQNGNSSWLQLDRFLGGVPKFTARSKQGAILCAVPGRRH